MSSTRRRARSLIFVMYSSTGVVGTVPSCLTPPRRGYRTWHLPVSWLNRLGNRVDTKGVATNGTQSVYRSTPWFTGLRIAETAVVAAIIALAMAHGPVWQAVVGATAASIIVLVAVVRLPRSCLIVRTTTITVRGLFRDRHLPASTIVGVSARPTWYSWKRIACPVTLFLNVSDGSQVRVGAVQSMVWNVGLARTSIEAEIARSYPQRVSDSLNAQFAGRASYPT